MANMGSKENRIFSIWLSTLKKKHPKLVVYDDISILKRVKGEQEMFLKFKLISPHQAIILFRRYLIDDKKQLEVYDPKGLIPSITREINENAWLRISGFYQERAKKEVPEEINKDFLILLHKEGVSLFGWWSRKK